MSHKESDEELIKAAIAGKQQAFRVLVERYESLVARTVIGMLGSNQESEDVGQEVFIRFYHALKNYKGEAKVSTYLCRIAINLSLNAIKKRKRVFQLFSSKNAEEVSDHVSISAESDYEHKELVHLALSKINTEFRAVIVLRSLQSYSVKETAEILKIPMGTVMSRQKRGQEQLKKVLEKLK